MAYATVGTNAAPTTAAAGSPTTPAFGTGQTRAAGDLLLLFVGVGGSATLPGTPAGWSIAAQKPGTSCSATIYYKIASGADAAPTIAAITGGALVAWLSELSGNAAVPLDQTATAAGTTSPQSATAGAADQAAGELVAVCGLAQYSAAAVKTLSVAFNNSVSGIQSTNDNATAAKAHYDLAYGVTGSNAAADQASLTFTTTNLTGAAVAVASFQLAAPPAPELMTMGVGS